MVENIFYGVMAGVDESIEISPISSNIFSVTVTDINNCADTASVNVVVNEEYCPPCTKYAVPNVFTPNGDQQNDYFAVFADGEITITNFQIYNRWGELIHNSPEPWDGNYKGNPAPSDVYIYNIELITNCETKQLKGDLTLIR